MVLTETEAPCGREKLDPRHTSSVCDMDCDFAATRRTAAHKQRKRLGVIVGGSGKARQR